MPKQHSNGEPLDTEWLEDFVALAAAQNFSRAAEARRITQPAFSRRIKMLEDWAGAPLFERLPRRVLLTPAGEQFRPYAQSIIRDIQQARDEARSAAGKSETTLAIAATHALSFTFFPKWAQARTTSGAFGSLNLMSDSMEACEEMMLRGDASFLLCHRHPHAVSRLDARSFRFRKVGEDLLVPTSAPTADGSPRWSLSADESRLLPYLAYATPSGLGRALDADWKTRGLKFILKPLMTARLAAALLTAAEDGQGLAWLPLSLAADSIARGSLVEAGGRNFATSVDIVLWRPTARLGKAAEHFWENLHDA